MKYRSDINGLRAIAVLAVVADHLGMATFSGGFLGVDVFFVISGYLISGVVFTEIQTNNFSIRVFYERRVRRILPALIAVLFLSFLLAYLYFLPNEMNDFATSLLAAILVVPNIYFWTESGYFAALATDLPLLHTWSLGVEEQFYIFFPAFLMFGYQFFRKQLNLFIVAIFAISLIAFIYGTLYHPEPTFYLTPTRAWELLLGSLLSLGLFPEILKKFSRNITSLIGISLITVAIMGFSRTTEFLSLGAILACLGTALVIAAGRNGSNIVARALSFRPVVFIGLISYSLYLWHWPIIVFHRMGFLQIDGLPLILEKLGIIIFSVVIASLSWKYIETPFRDKRLSVQTLSRFAFSSVTVLVLLVVGSLATNGFAFRFSSKVVEMVSHLDRRPIYRDKNCFISTGRSYSDFDTSKCINLSSTKKNYLLIGDSHAAALWYGLSSVFPDVNIMQATASGCKPNIEHQPTNQERCTKIIDYIFKEYLPANTVDAILIDANWKLSDLPFLARTLDYAKEHTQSVVLFGPMVSYNSALPKLLAVSYVNDDPAYPFHNRRVSSEKVDKEMAKVAQEKNIAYISFFDMLCDTTHCETTLENNIPLLFDYGHLTSEGAVYVARRIGNIDRLP